MSEEQFNTAHLIINIIYLTYKLYLVSKVKANKYKDLVDTNSNLNLKKLINLG
jgi:hypothetical protein